MSLQRSRFEAEDEQRRLSVFHLVGLAAGGVIGSGWMLGANKAFVEAGSDAWLAWLFGGLLMLLIAGVMVELGTAAPKTGGLIFLPLQSSGALVATVAAAGLWLVYAINLASEAVAMTRGLSSWKVKGLLASTSDSDALTTKGWCYSLVFMAAISAVNLVAPRIFFRINSWLTVLKVVIPVLTVVLLIVAGFDRHGPGTGEDTAGKGAFAAMTAVVTSGVIYAYVGFQGPLDFAGNVKQRSPGEAARLRRAVFGTIVGSMVLYIALQVVFTRFHGLSMAHMASSPYADFAYALGLSWLGVLLNMNAVVSPMGAGLVFAHALTREVAGFSRAHLTHRGLQTARKASLNRRYDVYWLVLVVDFFVAAIALWAMGGSWSTLVAVTGVLTLVVYAVPAVTLVSLRAHLEGYSGRRRDAHEVLARTSFALIALVLYGAGWTSLWQGMVALAVGWVLLLFLPSLARWLPAFGRIYDAKVHVTLFRDVRESPAAQAALWLLGHLVVLLSLTLLRGDAPIGFDQRFLGGFLAVTTALVSFEGLVRASRRHMAGVPPMLPTPAPATSSASSAEAVSAVTE
jgi:amino acid transporter